MPREVSKLINTVVNNLSAILIMSNGFAFDSNCQEKKIDWFSLFFMKVNEESFVSETRFQ